MAMACKPEEQKRLIVAPATVTGRPARTAAIRATFVPCVPSGLAQPRDDVFDLVGSKLRHLAQHVLDGVSGQVVGPREIERAAETLGQRRSRAGDDNGFSHRSISTRGTARRDAAPRFEIELLHGAAARRRSRLAPGPEPAARERKMGKNLPPIRAYRPFGRMYLVASRLKSPPLGDFAVFDPPPLPPLGSRVRAPRPPGGDFE